MNYRMSNLVVLITFPLVEQTTKSQTLNISRASWNLAIFCPTALAIPQTYEIPN